MAPSRRTRRRVPDGDRPQLGSRDVRHHRDRPTDGVRRARRHREHRRQDPGPHETDRPLDPAGGPDEDEHDRPHGHARVRRRVRDPRQAIQDQALDRGPAGGGDGVTDIDPADEVRSLRDRVAELEAAEAGRDRAVRVQAALYRIAETASTAHDMQEFYAEIHRIVGELMYAENFYIVLYDEDRQAMNWAFAGEEVDTDWSDSNVWEPMGTGQSTGVTGYLFNTGVPMLMTTADLDRLAD